MFTSIDKALAAAIMGTLFIVQTYTGFSIRRHDCDQNHSFSRSSACAAPPLSQTVRRPPQR
jgi:hypothetical protein